MQPCEGLFGRGKAKNVMLVIPVSVSPRPLVSLAVLWCLFLLSLPPHLPSSPHYSIRLSYRSSPLLAPTTQIQGGLEATWRQSTKWKIWGSPSTRSGTLTTFLQQKSRWRTRWSQTNRNFIYGGGGKIALVYLLKTSDVFKSHWPLPQG